MKKFNSLKKKKDFDVVYNNKSFYSDDLYVMYIIDNVGFGMESNRLGISISKKVGNSVVRHKIIRRTREIFRQNEKELDKSFDIILVCREKSKFANYENLNNSFIKLCKKHKIYKEQK